jgi:hypothetical protein
VNLYADPISVQAEINRRFELAGVDPHHRHDDGHRHEVPSRPIIAHPLAAFVARLVGGSASPSPASRRGASAHGRPRHP